MDDRIYTNLDEISFPLSAEIQSFDEELNVDDGNITNQCEDLS
jgi:hypothetical protein